jgi:hypothetical protein
MDLKSSICYYIYSETKEDKHMNKTKGIATKVGFFGASTTVATIIILVLNMVSVF